jgi:hypothetical protein
MDDLRRLSLKESWFTSEDCQKLTEYAKEMISIRVI